MFVHNARVYGICGTHMWLHWHTIGTWIFLFFFKPGSRSRGTHPAQLWRSDKMAWSRIFLHRLLISQGWGLYAENPLIDEDTDSYKDEAGRNMTCWNGGWKVLIDRSQACYAVVFDAPRVFNCSGVFCATSLKKNKQSEKSCRHLRLEKTSSGLRAVGKGAYILSDQL